MATELIVNASLPETRIALMEDGEIQELLIERDTGKGIVGNIYKGRVTRVLPGMQAAFVDIGLEKAAFLYVDDVFVHSSIWSEEEGESEEGSEYAQAMGDSGEQNQEVAALEGSGGSQESESSESNVDSADLESSELETADEIQAAAEEAMASEESAQDPNTDSSNDANTDTNSDTDSGSNTDQIPSEGTPVEASLDSTEAAQDIAAQEAPEEVSSEEATNSANEENSAQQGSIRFERGRRGRRGKKPFAKKKAKAPTLDSIEAMPESFQQQVSEEGDVVSDRASVSGETMDSNTQSSSAPRVKIKLNALPHKNQRGRDRRLPPRGGSKGSRASVNIQDLLKEGQEVIVQVSKDPIATKGARLTCHLSLPGRHLVCMPTIDHVGVSRRIERDDERRRLREFVESHRPKKLGFIVRTATAGNKQSSEKRIAQDIDYLSKLWDEIKEKANEVQAPAMIYEDLTPVLRAIRDWVNEDIDKVVVDARYPFNQVQKFVRDFMPDVYERVELYQGDLPIFDAYNISSELARALERKVWLKSGGYLVIDQAEALVAIDVNTGRFVGKRSLEDTILKTNLEAVKEIAYQLRLRNCGGIIILDLIDMDREDHKFRVYRALEEELRKDRARPQILKISELGLVEMTRKRTRDTMVRSLCEPCSHCEGKGFMKSKQSVAYEVLRDLERSGIDRESQKILIQAHPDVIDTLAIDERETLDQLERRYRKSIFLQAVTDYHPEQFEVLSDKQMKSQPERSDDRILDKARDSLTRAEGKENRSRGRDRFRDRNSGNDRGRDRERNQNQNQNAGGNTNSIRPKSQPGVITPVARPLIRPKDESDAALLDSSEALTELSYDENGNPIENSSAIGQDSAIGDSAMSDSEGAEETSTSDIENSDGTELSGDESDGESENRRARMPQDEDSVGNRVHHHSGGRNGRNQRRNQRGPARVATPEDEDSIGNRIDYQPSQPSEGVAFSAPTYAEEDEFSEEDRRAYLRAQAAQDAALQRIGAHSGVPGTSGGHGGSRRDRGGRWGQQNNNNNRNNNGRYGGNNGRFQNRNNRGFNKGNGSNGRFQNGQGFRGRNQGGQGNGGGSPREEGAPQVMDHGIPETSSGQDQ